MRIIDESQCTLTLRDGRTLILQVNVPAVLWRRLNRCALNVLRFSRAELSQSVPTTPTHSPAIVHEQNFCPPSTFPAPPCCPPAEVRERDWQNVVTCHEGHPHAYLWHLRSFAIAKLRLVPPGSSPAPATVSVVGNASGHDCGVHLQAAVSQAVCGAAPLAPVQHWLRICAARANPDVSNGE